MSFCAGSAQDLWLQQDLASHASNSCVLAYYQNPRWASAASGSGGDNTYQQIWQDLYAGHADVVLNGNSRWYERFAPQNASGAIDNAHGVREFIVGTGGAGLDTPGTEVPTSQVLNNTTHGVIRITLHNGSYDWKFVPDEGTFTDSRDNFMPLNATTVKFFSETSPTTRSPLKPQLVPWPSTLMGQPS